MENSSRSPVSSEIGEEVKVVLEIVERGKKISLG